MAEAIDSILAQTYTNWDLIMCDDGSTDGTYTLAKKYKEAFPDKIILLKNERNRKLSFTLNRCLEAATGELIARMDGDDISHRDRFDKQVAYLFGSSGYSVGCAMRRFDEKGFRDVMHPVLVPDRWTLRYRVPFYHATILTYKKVFDALHGYNDTDRTTRVEDRDLWFRFYANGFSGANIDEVLYDVRENADTNKPKDGTFTLSVSADNCLWLSIAGISKIWLLGELFFLIAKSIIPYRVKQWFRDKTKE